jgi:hypothetical protein
MSASASCGGFSPYVFDPCSPGEEENEMRILLASLIALFVLYFWDQNYNNGRFFDGLHSMGRAISHGMFK